MSLSSSLGVHPIRLAHVLAFGLTAVACFACTVRAGRVDSEGIRHGLAGLLVLSGAWAGTHVGRLVFPSQSLGLGFYVVGLFVGFGSVLAWLYFCSAYTGRSYHRKPAYRLAGLALFGAVVLLKITNPLHQLYYEASFVTTPFPHVVIDQLVFYWIVTGLAYVLAGVGFYLLFEQFVEVNYDTSPLGLLVVLCAVPVALSLAGFVDSEFVLALNYEPIGVAAFAVGVLYVTEESFLDVPRLGRQQLIKRLGQAVFFLDTDHRLLEVNRTARERFPGVENDLGEHIEASALDLENPVAADGQVVTVDTDTDGHGPVHYLVRVTPLTAGETVVGRAVVLTDVTEVERQRQELRRQNEQLDGFAAAVAHELRNSLEVVDRTLEVMNEELERGERGSAGERIETAAETTEHMERVVSDLTRVVRLSQTVTDTSLVDFDTAVREAWRRGCDDLSGVELEVSGNGLFETETTRLEELVCNVGRIARDRSASTVRFALDGSEFRITVGGDRITTRSPNAALEYGTTVPDSHTGMLFANVQSLARAHGWTVELGADDQASLQLQVSGVTTDLG